MSDERLATIERKLDETRQEMRALNQETRHEMRLLHEDLVDKIEVLAPDFTPIERKIQQASAEVRESLEPRIGALEAAERTRRD